MRTTAWDRPRKGVDVVRSEGMDWPPHSDQRDRQCQRLGLPTVSCAVVASRSLFQTSFLTGAFNVSADGQTVPPDDPEERRTEHPSLITVVTNWPAALNQPGGAAR
jgi:hypothetical protein